MNALIASKLELLPELPGSYQMRDAYGKIIYIGKAKNLKHRVRSYFVGSHDEKTTRLVQIVEDLTYVVTKTETEAFLLELSLIKEHTPKYNILLMDDKTYPYIEVTDETHPRLQITRRVSKKNKNVYGPFPSAGAARDTLDLLHRLFPLRKCQTMPKKLCLYYHIGQCKGPCVLPVNPEDYKPILIQIKQFFNGNNSDILADLRRRMETHAAALEFEKAQEYKLLMEAVRQTTERQQVIFPDQSDRDVFAYHAGSTHLAITMLFMRGGRIVFSESKLFALYEDPSDALIDFLAQFYQKQPIPKEVLLPKAVDNEWIRDLLGDKAVFPSRGPKKKLLEMARDNAEIYLQNHIDLYLRQEQKATSSLEELARLSKVDGVKRIEAFDNSHTMGTNQVSAMVVFVNGQPAKKEYRKYKSIDAISGDDLGQMKETLYRRYQKMLVEGLHDRPDLIIMDGGLLQVKAAKEVLSQLYLDIPVVGLKKDGFHKTDALIDAFETEVKLDRHHPVYVLLSRIQDEAHRFAITFHRQTQTKNVLASILDAIPGIGPTTKRKLLEHFKTIPAIKAASEDELRSIGLTKPQIANLKIALLPNPNEMAG
jgi:excinuclease ABC subunit C